MQKIKQQNRRTVEDKLQAAKNKLGIIPKPNSNPQNIVLNRNVSTERNEGILHRVCRNIIINRKDLISSKFNQIPKLQLPKDGSPLNLRFYHGLGDLVQFYGVVLSHLPPEININLITRTQGWDGISVPAAYSVRFGEGRYVENLPCTKPTRCLLEEFGIEPDIGKYRYKCPYALINRKLDYILLHPYGSSNRNRKDMSREELELLYKELSKNNEVVVLDPNNEIRDARYKRITGYFHIKELWKHICQAKAIVGIDSGVEHLALAADLPVHIIWKGMNPFQNIDPHPTLVNWINKDVFERFPDWDLDWSLDNYNCQFYTDSRKAIQEICSLF